MPTAADPAAEFAAHRDLLVGVAYRIVGQMADAEDVVQEAWLRWSAANADDVRDPRAFLVTIASRLALDRLRRVKARREAYVGEWLPEPIRTAVDPAEQVALGDSISMALLVVLETLSPLERAVYVLREAFGFTHAEIASALGRSEPAVRQLARRARDHVAERRPRYDPDPAMRREVTERFLAASASGDVDALLRTLAPDVELVADGGGRVRAPLLRVRGAQRVVRFLIAAARRPVPAQRIGLVELNGGPAIVVWSGETAVTAVIADVADGRVAHLHLVANPAKLARLGDPPG